VDGALPVPDELLRQRAQALETAVHPEGQVGELLRERERRGQRPREAQLCGHHEAPPGLAVADRDRLARLEQVELQQLARSIERPLIGAPRQVAGPQLAQVIVEDRPPALIAELLDQLADPLAGQAWIRTQQAIDLVAEGIEL
jgi:hypothetical protein